MTQIASLRRRYLPDAHPSRVRENSRQSGALVHRAANDLIITDTIPYETGTAMMQGAWRMFRACATTSMKPRAQIRSNYSSLADEIAATARMAHTKRGSFIIPLLLPVSEPPEIDPGLVDAAPPEPMERRVMRTFAEALTRMHDLVVTPKREPRPEDTFGLMFAGVSAEFASALHKVLIEDAVTEFGCEVSVGFHRRTTA